jgi:hypothetical protein
MKNMYRALTKPLLLIATLVAMLLAWPLAANAVATPATPTAATEVLVNASPGPAAAGLIPIYQCPARHCNQGHINAGQRVPIYCQANVWYLAYNPQNEHVGFVHRENLATAPSVVNCAGVGSGTSVNNPETIYQCPQDYCNPGQAYPRNDIAQICHAKNVNWTLVLNHQNGHVGFILAGKLNDLGAWGAC